MMSEFPPKELLQKYIQRNKAKLEQVLDQKTLTQVLAMMFDLSNDESKFQTFPPDIRQTTFKVLCLVFAEYYYDLYEDKLQ